MFSREITGKFAVFFGLEAIAGEKSLGNVEKSKIEKFIKFVYFASFGFNKLQI